VSCALTNLFMARAGIYCAVMRLGLAWPPVVADAEYVSPITASPHPKRFLAAVISMAAIQHQFPSSGLPPGNRKVAATALALMSCILGYIRVAVLYVTIAGYPSPLQPWVWCAGQIPPSSRCAPYTVTHQRFHRKFFLLLTGRDAGKLRDHLTGLATVCLNCLHQVLGATVV
jgi:hypothetical protein